MIHYSSDDVPIWTSEYKILTHAQLNITGLRMIGHANFRKASSPLGPHYHHVKEFVVILKGRQRYSVNECHYSLCGGDIFMTLPEEVHGGNNNPQEICDFIWFQFDLSSEENFLDLKPPYSHYMFWQLYNYEKRLSHTSQESLRILPRVIQLLHSDNPHEHLKGYNYFVGFLLDTLCRENYASDDIGCASVISAATDYIKAHLLENPTLDTIAEHCGLSRSKLYSKFKEQIGITPHVYTTMLKIDLAKTLLKNPKNSITDVAFQLNFASSNHFSSAFKQYTGETPSIFRQRLQQETSE